MVKDFRKRVKARAKKRVKEQSERAAEVGTLPFRVLPLTAPFAGPIRRVFPRTVDKIVDSGLVDDAIERQIDSQLARNPNLRRRLDQANMVEPTPSRSTNLDRVRMTSDLTREIVTDADIIQDLENLQIAAGGNNRSSLLEYLSLLLQGSELIDEVLPPAKRTRKKTKTDAKMSVALAQANKELRKRNGDLRKGKTQADVMRRAHRIRRKMS